MFKNFIKGIIAENPVLVLALGLCPTLAVTTSIENAIGMGVAVIAVLTCSNIIVSLIRKFVPTNIRIPIFIVIIASFVTMIDMVMAAFTPEIHKSLGLFIPLIVVNCIILGRAEAYASKNSIFDSIIDALGMGIGNLLALVIVAAFREFLGTGKLLGYLIMPKTWQPALIMILPPGGFLTLGLILGFFNKMKERA